MRILLSNDDGVTAPGLHALAAELRKLGRVFICAPDRVRSGASSALTLHEPLVAEPVGKDCWGVSGTPADAVKLALHELMEEPPDVVVSGINNGLNTGTNIVYSGTVAAALEGAQYGITSFAVSRKVAPDGDYRVEARLAAAVIAELAPRHPRCATAFNINLPSVRRPKGVIAATAELTPYSDGFDRRTDPRGRTYFWLRGTPPRNLRRNGRPTDDWAIARGYISVTPLRRDLTDAALLDDLARIYPDAR